MPLKKISDAISQITNRQPFKGGSSSQVLGLGARARPDARVKVRAAGPIRTRYVQLAPFESIEADIPVDIEWRPGDNQDALVSAPENIMKHLRLVLNGRKLIITSDVGFDGARVKCQLVGYKLMEVHLASSCLLDAYELEAGRLIVSTRNSSCAIFQGEVAEAHYEAHDESSIDAASLSAYIAIAELSGSACVLLRAREAVEAQMSPHSVLFSIGKPKLMETHREKRTDSFTVGQDIGQTDK